MPFFKCLSNSNKHSSCKSLKAQNLIEFIFVFPMLIFLTLVIFEVALFWQDVNSVYNLNAEINANVALIDPKNPRMDLGTRCTAAKRAIDILKSKDSMISLNDPSYNDSAPINDSGLVLYGKEPFALYKYSAGKIDVLDSDGNKKPQVTLWVDCRSPFEDGITTQLEFYHKTLIMKASIPRFDKGEPIEVIPDHIFIASPKLNTIRHY